MAGEDQVTQMTIIMVGFAVTIAIFIHLIILFFNKAMANYRIWKEIDDRQKLYEQKMREKDDMREKGDLHEWVSIPFGTDELLVCRKTGWCPERKSFIELHYIKMQEEKRKLDAEYKVHRDEKVKKLAKEHSLSLDDMESLVESVFDMKKQFFLKHMDRSIKEMQEKANERKTGV